MELVVDYCEEWRVCMLAVKLVLVRVGNEVSEWFPVRVGLR